MKICLADEALDKEITFIKNIRSIKTKGEYQCDAIPHIVAHGKFVNQIEGGAKEKVDFLVMNRYYYTLD